MSRGRRGPAGGRARPKLAVVRTRAESGGPLLALSMIVRDEEANLRRLLPPIRDLFDELVVADTGSSDGTVAYLESLGARVVSFPWTDDFGAARNASLAGVTARWVLWLDADDALSRESAEQIRAVAAASPPRAAYYLELENAGARPEESSVCNQLRLFPNLPGVAFEGRIHEQVALRLKSLGVPFLRAPIRVVHTGYVDPAAVRSKFERNHRILTEEIAARPDDPFLLYHLAQTCVGLGRRDDALAALSAFAARGWGEGVEREMALQARVLAARLHEAGGERAAARAELEAALREEPSHGLARLFLAQRAIADGDGDTGIELLEPLVFGEGLKPGVLPYPVGAANETAALLLASALLDAGRAEEAHAALERAVRHSSEAPARWLRFAEAAIAKKQEAIALKALSRASRDVPDAFEPKFLEGTLWLQAGRLDEAERALNAALAERPAAPEALVNLGNVALARGDGARAESFYREALAADPDFALASENLAKSFLVSGRASEAAPLLEALLAGDPSRIDLVAHLGDVYLAAGRAGEAIRAFEAVLAAQPESVITWTLLGDAYRALGVLEAARLSWARALAIAPNDAGARARLGRFAPPAPLETEASSR